MAKIVQGECSASSLLECNAEPQLILCKDNTFRSGHSEVAERFDQIPGKKARHGQTCQGFQHMEPSGEHDILSVLPMDGTHHNTAVRCPQAAGYIQMALLEPRCIT